MLILTIWFFYLQALPICLDKIFHPFVAVILSVTFVLAFGEVHGLSKIILWFDFGVQTLWCFLVCNWIIFCLTLLYHSQVIPQAICTRYGLAVGANFVWLVRILMIVCYPIAYPVGKVIFIRNSWILKICEGRHYRIFF